MLDKIPNLSNNLDILVMFNLEFLIALKSRLNNDLSKVWFLTPCPIKKQIAINSGIKENFIIDYEYNSKINVENMPKFDVVIGNPPYHKIKIGNGDASGKPFWHKFVELAFSITKENGYICLVHPSTWRFGKVSERSAIYNAQQLLFNKQIKYLKTFFQFEKLGVMVDFYIVQNKPSEEKTNIDFLDGNDNININGIITYIKNYSNILIKSIENKCFSKIDNNLITVWGWGGEWENLDEKKKKDNYNWKKGPKIINKLGFPHIYHYNKKVIGRVSRKIQAIYDEGNIGIGDHNYYLLVNNEIEGKNLEFIWNSDLMIFFQKIYNTFCDWSKEGGVFWNSNIPFKRLFCSNEKLITSNEDLYKFYNFSEEEINYINKQLNN